jgi:hypothetical protein
MRKVFLLVPVFFLAMALTNSASAQEYKTAVGARLGFPVSASLKHFITDSHALEVYAGFRSWPGYNWVNISGAYQVHNPLNIEGIEGLQWYFGGGASVFFWNYRGSFLNEFNSTTFGIQGYLGLDYAFPNTPINLSVDWVPTFFLGGGFLTGFGGGYGSLAVRYILSR